MNRSVFKHGYWAASRGLQSQGATTISILFPTKTMMYFLTNSLSSESAFCNIFGVQKGHASFEHMFNPCWGSVVLLRSHILGICSTIEKSHMNRNVFKHGLLSCLQGIAKPRSHNYIHTFSDQNHDVFFWPNLFHQRAPFVTFSMFRKGMHHLNIFSINVGDL